MRTGSSRPLATFFVPGLLVAVMLVGGVWYYHTSKQTMQREVAADLSSIAEHKTRLIEQWRHERLADARVLAAGFPDAASTDADQARGQALLTEVCAAYGYNAATILDAQGRVLVGVGATGMPPEVLAAVAESRRRGEPRQSALYRRPSDGAVHLSFVATSPERAVVLECRADDFLYPLVLSWPLPSKTAESLLVRRDGNDVLFLNELRHRKDTALNLRLPLVRADLPANMAVQGRTGIVEGVDYRDRPVLAYLRHIPGSEWYMVVKIDRAEALAVWREQSFLILALLLGLLCIAAAVGVILWQGQRNRVYRQLLEAEAARALYEQRFRIYFEESLVGMAIAGPDQRWRQVNDSLCQMLGYTAEQLGAMAWTDVTHPDDIAEDTARFDRLLAGDISGYRLEKRFIRQDGDVVHAIVSLKAVRKPDGSLDYLLKQVQDITRRHQAETNLRHLNTELERSNAELAQFAHVASHDLQEPLRMIASFTQLLAQRYGDKLDDKARQWIDYAVDGAARMQELINALLNYSRVHSRGERPVPVDSGACLERAIANLRLAIDEAHARIDADDLPEVPADASQLTQLFQNLVSNAVKYRGEAPLRIRVTAREEPGQWVFSVADNGIGIAPEHQERIFAIFQRLHSHAEYPGTGIGLAVCRRIVERHGGRIWVESAAGQGATFHFTLPKVPPVTNLENVAP